MFTGKLRVLLPLPMAGQFTLTMRRPLFEKALTSLMTLHSMSAINQTANRTLTTKRLSKSIELLSNSSKEIKLTPGNSFKIQSGWGNDGRPLAVLLCWLLSNKKNVLKYAQFYLDQGFDVLTVQTNPWQLLWPISGTQVVARDVLSFMSVNEKYKTTILHGFSVGGYLWGEILNMVQQDLPKYRPLLDRIAGQIWDSAVDYEGIPTGLPKAVFPKNAILRSSLEKYVTYHMATFYEPATKHYLQASKMAHYTIVKAPALFLCSLDDPICSTEGIKRVTDKWKDLGIEVFIKAWKSSPHVSHLHHHPEEYKQEMKAFLEKLGLVPYPEKFLLQKAVG